MLELRKRLENLINIPQNEWTDQDRALIEKVRNYDFLDQMR
jgi:hypothetical protein